MKTTPEEIRVAWMIEQHGGVYFMGKVPADCSCPEEDIDGVEINDIKNHFSPYVWEHKFGRIKIGSIAEYVDDVIDSKIDEALANKISWKIDDDINKKIERHYFDRH